MGPRNKLRGQRTFSAVYGARVRKNVGPIGVFARPNELAYSRMGLSVPRRAGTAVARNRIKRLLREAFRLTQHELPGGYDIIVTVRPHLPATLDEYKGMLERGIRWVDGEWARRRRD